MRNSKQYYKKLRLGNICGVIDSYGAVKSEFSEEGYEYHEDLFGYNQVKWRWNFDKSIFWLTSESKPKDEQFSQIEDHITKKYGIKFWENGHHDIDDLLTKAGYSRSKDGVWIDDEN